MEKETLPPALVSRGNGVDCHRPGLPYRDASANGQHDGGGGQWRNALPSVDRALGGVGDRRGNSPIWAGENSQHRIQAGYSGAAGGRPPRRRPTTTPQPPWGGAPNSF